MAELKPYNPTIRDRIASALMGEARPGSARANVVEGLMGSRGIGTTGIGLADLTPIGAGLGVQEAAREGDYRGAAMNAMFLGPMARTANRTALTQAEKMAAGGANRDEIWNKTGWFQGPDSKWRFEINDSGIPTKFIPTEDKLFQYPKAPEYVPHKELYDAYPHLKNVRLAPEFEAGTRGGFDPSQNVVSLRPIDKGDFTPKSGTQTQSTFLHEMQHAVQEAEGFSKGANSSFGWPAQMVDERAAKLYQNSAKPSKNPEIDALAAQLAGFDQPVAKSSAPWDALPMRQRVEWYEPARNSLYYDAAGEVEARNVQRRLNMTPEQRRETPPWVTQDVPFSEQILRAFGSK